MSYRRRNEAERGRRETSNPFWNFDNAPGPKSYRSSGRRKDVFVSAIKGSRRIVASLTQNSPSFTAASARDKVVAYADSFAVGLLTVLLPRDFHRTLITMTSVAKPATLCVRQYAFVPIRQLCSKHVQVVHARRLGSTSRLMAKISIRPNENTETRDGSTAAKLCQLVARGGIRFVSVSKELSPVDARKAPAASFGTRTAELMK